jgi:hypothetical protein
MKADGSDFDRLLLDQIADRWRNVGNANHLSCLLHSPASRHPGPPRYRWHPLYGQIARVRRTVPRSTSEVLFCELPDGATGTLPAWMTDAAACAALTVGAPVVSIAALQELRELLDAVVPRAPDPPHASMPSKEGCDATNESVDPHPDPAVPPAADVALRSELTAAQHQELLRAVAELLLRAAVDASATTPTGGRDADR